jgi:hypothetical protein
MAVPSQRWAPHGAQQNLQRRNEEKKKRKVNDFCPLSSLVSDLKELAEPVEAVESPHQTGLNVM